MLNQRDLHNDTAGQTVLHITAVTQRDLSITATSRNATASQRANTPSPHQPPETKALYFTSQDCLPKMGLGDNIEFPNTLGVLNCVLQNKRPAAKESYAVSSLPEKPRG